MHGKFHKGGFIFLCRSILVSITPIRKTLNLQFECFNVGLKAWLLGYGSGHYGNKVI